MLNAFVAREVSVAKQWWYESSGEKAGPVEEAVLLEQYLSGALAASTLVWAAGQEDWAPMASVLRLPVRPPDLPPVVPPTLPLAMPQAPTFTPSAYAQPTGRVALAKPGFESPDTNQHTGQTVSSTVDLATAWRRFSARMLDTAIFGYAGYGVSLAVMTSTGFVSDVPSPIEDGIWYFALFFVAGPILTSILEGLWWSFFRGTPGKSVLGVQVVKTDGTPPDGFEYGGRLAAMYVQAFALQIPLISLFPVLFQYMRVSRGKPASYDSGKYQVLYREQERVGLGIVKVVGMLFLSLLIAVAAMALGSLANVPQVNWTNPLNGKTTRIAESWTVEERKDANGWKVNLDHSMPQLVAEVHLLDELEFVDWTMRESAMDILLADYADKVNITERERTKVDGDTVVWRAGGPHKKQTGKFDLLMSAKASEKTVWVVVTLDPLDTSESRAILADLRKQLLRTQ